MSLGKTTARILRGAARRLDPPSTVVGIEAGSRFRFIAGDVHEVLNSEDLEVDVVLCLGFLYHTLRFTELLHGIRRTGAQHLVLDTIARPMLLPEPLIRLHSERIDYQGNAKPDAYSVGDHVLTGRPNLAAIRLMLGCYGYEVERLSDWPRLLADNRR